MRAATPLEVASYDTYPKEEELFKMKGAWGIYADFPSGRIVVSDRVNGLFLFDFPAKIISSLGNGELSIYPNPQISGNPLTLSLTDKTIDAFSLFIYDSAGRLVFTDSFEQQTYAQVEHFLGVGVYQIRVQYTDYLDEQQAFYGKFIVN